MASRVMATYVSLLLAASLLCVHLTWATQLPEDCSGVSSSSSSEEVEGGVYLIQPRGFPALSVLCEFRDGDGYIVIQNNVGGMDWTQDYDSYRNGFGTISATSSFWLGLEKIYWVTRGDEVELLIVVTNTTEETAKYKQFILSNESDGYTLNFKSFDGGNAGDGFRDYHRNRPFSTKGHDVDSDLDRDCAVLNHGGWWYNDCVFSALNKGNIYWNEKSSYYSESRMLVKGQS